MSNKNIITATAAAISVMEEALEAARLEHASLSTERIEAKMAAFSEVVGNTRRKMNRPAGFDWALHHSFSVTEITADYLKVQAFKPHYTTQPVTLMVPRSDLSLSTWQITSEIRRQSAQRLLDELNARVSERKTQVTKDRKEVKAAETRLAESERTLTEATAAVDKRLARTKTTEAKRAAARLRRQTARAAVAQGVPVSDSDVRTEAKKEIVETPTAVAS